MQQVLTYPGELSWNGAVQVGELRRPWKSRVGLTTRQLVAATGFYFARVNFWRVWFTPILG